eukprot:6486136-Amphidinium_carterae.2
MPPAGPLSLPALPCRGIARDVVTKLHTPLSRKRPLFCLRLLLCSLVLASIPLSCNTAQGCPLTLAACGPTAAARHPTPESLSALPGRLSGPVCHEACRPASRTATQNAPAETSKPISHGQVPQTHLPVSPSWLTAAAAALNPQVHQPLHPHADAPALVALQQRPWVWEDAKAVE